MKKKLFKINLNMQAWDKNLESTINYKFITVITNFLCKYFPKFIRKPLMANIYKSVLLLSRIISLIYQLKISLYLIEGKEKHSGKIIRILYISNEKFDPYLSSIIFTRVTRCTKIKRIPIFNIGKEFCKYSSKIDAILTKCDMFYSDLFEKLGFIIIPEWVSMTLNLADSIENLYRKFHNKAKQELRKAEKYNYSYEISKDLDEFEHFYYNMYLPYLIFKHKNFALCSNYLAIRYLFESGYKMIFFKYDNKPVSGMLFSQNKQIIKPKIMGILEDKINLMKKGLGSISYYFLIKLALENSVKIIDFGATRPFLKDGSYRFKKKWGTKINRADTLFFYNIFALKICSDNEGIQTFLKENPFIYYKKSQYNKMIANKIN